MRRFLLSTWFLAIGLLLLGSSGITYAQTDTTAVPVPHWLSTPISRRWWAWAKNAR
ncbi:MAG: hypothetical protein H6668_20490 [Ardenticatenaceae bacterium]|nr:hypothetical protein [Ardenticatenaceae bacterium]